MLKPSIQVRITALLEVCMLLAGCQPNPVAIRPDHSAEQCLKLNVLQTSARDAVHNEIFLPAITLAEMQANLQSPALVKRALGAKPMILQYFVRKPGADEAIAEAAAPVRIELDSSHIQHEGIISLEIVDGKLNMATFHTTAADPELASGQTQVSQDLPVTINKPIVGAEWSFTMHLQTNKPIQDGEYLVRILTDMTLASETMERLSVTNSQYGFEFRYLCPNRYEADSLLERLLQTINEDDLARRRAPIDAQLAAIQREIKEVEKDLPRMAYFGPGMDVESWRAERDQMGEKAWKSKLEKETQAQMRWFDLLAKQMELELSKIEIQPRFDRRGLVVDCDD